MREAREFVSSHRVSRVVGGVALTAVILAACGGGDGKDVGLKSATSSTTVKKPTTTSAQTTSTTQTTGTTETTSSTASAWDADAQQYRGQNGKKFTIECPPDGTESMIWGTGVYTDDSSICTAAVQLGLIQFATGGKVEIEIAPGKNEYAGGTANGVTSTRYGSWTGSFTFPAAPPGLDMVAVGPESWGRNAVEYRGQNATRVTVECSSNGVPGSVWGTDTYTDDSSICTAAVHSGLITLVAGGTVVIEVAPGESAYSGTPANGITSEDYGTFSGSFTFPKDQTPS